MSVSTLGFNRLGAARRERLLCAGVQHAAGVPQAPAGLGGAAREIKSGSQPIGPNNGKLLIRSYKDGMGAKLAHDLILTATKWNGTLNIDGDNPAASNATLSIDSQSIEIVEAVGG